MKINFKIYKFKTIAGSSDTINKNESIFYVLVFSANHKSSTDVNVCLPNLLTQYTATIRISDNAFCNNENLTISLNAVSLFDYNIGMDFPSGSYMLLYSTFIHESFQLETDFFCTFIAILRCAIWCN